MTLGVIPLTGHFQKSISYNHQGNVRLPGHGSDLKYNKIHNSNSILF